MKKFFALLLCAAIGLSVVGCGESEISQDEKDAEAAKLKTTGSITITPTKAEFVKDSKGATGIVVTVTFKNDTSKDQVFNTAANIQVEQGGKALVKAVMEIKDYDPAIATLKIKNGESKEFKVPFQTADSKTAVDISCAATSGENKEAVKTQIAVTQ